MEAFRQSLAVIVVLALLAGALICLRRFGRGGLAALRRSKAGESKMQLVERLALTPQHSLHLVRVCDRLLLLSVHSSGIHLLESFPGSGPECIAPGLQHANQNRPFACN